MPQNDQNLMEYKSSSIIPRSTTIYLCSAFEYPTKLNCKIGTQTSMAAFFTAMEILVSPAQYKKSLEMDWSSKWDGYITVFSFGQIQAHPPPPMT